MKKFSHALLIGFISFIGAQQAMATELMPTDSTQKPPPSSAMKPNDLDEETLHKALLFAKELTILMSTTKVPKLIALSNEHFKALINGKSMKMQNDKYNTHTSWKYDSERSKIDKNKCLSSEKINLVLVVGQFNLVENIEFDRHNPFNDPLASFIRFDVHAPSKQIVGRLCLKYVFEEFDETVERQLRQDVSPIPAKLPQNTPQQPSSVVTTVNKLDEYTLRKALLFANEFTLLISKTPLPTKFQMPLKDVQDLLGGKCIRQHNKEFNTDTFWQYIPNDKTCDLLKKCSACKELTLWRVQQSVNPSALDKDFIDPLSSFHKYSILTGPSSITDTAGTIAIYPCLIDFDVNVESKLREALTLRPDQIPQAPLENQLADALKKVQIGIANKQEVARTGTSTKQ